jgi:hypothetical protein
MSLAHRSPLRSFVNGGILIRSSRACARTGATRDGASARSTAPRVQGDVLWPVPVVVLASFDDPSLESRTSSLLHPSRSWPASLCRFRATDG